ncbi:MAG: energy transducer TonB [Candidatus Cybelea sp.]
MSIRADCGAAERLAGAIALDEACDAEREVYRKHLAACPQCVSELGGEREIERVMTSVARARDDERWEPDLRPALARSRVARPRWSAMAAVAAAAMVILFVRVAEKPASSTAPQSAITAQETRALAALGTQTAPRREGRAESLAVGPPTLSATVELNVNARGTPVRCTVAKSSGNAVLDRSMCRTAMRAHYALQPPR